MPTAPLRRAIARKFAVEPRAAHYLHRDRLWLCHAEAMMASGIGLHIPGSKRPDDDEEEGEELGEPSLLGPGLLGKLDPTSRKKLDKPTDIQFQDPKVTQAAISLQRVCRPVKQGPSFSNTSSTRKVHSKSNIQKLGPVFYMGSAPPPENHTGMEQFDK